ncbi:MAG: EF-hand domain-containing protein [Gammaproteobacteria bacterium]|jgi:Ca2+-binding EF-hand superfamily protein
MRYALVTGAVAALLSFSVSAGEGDMAHNKMFKQLDKDGNGIISKEEAGANKELTEAWKELDKDTSGGLEMSEFAAFESAEAFTPMEEENEPIGAAPTE